MHHRCARVCAARGARAGPTRQGVVRKKSLVEQVAGKRGLKLSPQAPDADEAKSTHPKTMRHQLVQRSTDLYVFRCGPCAERGRSDLNLCRPTRCRARASSPTRAPGSRARRLRSWTPETEGRSFCRDRKRPESRTCRFRAEIVSRVEKTRFLPAAPAGQRCLLASGTPDPRTAASRTFKTSQVGGLNESPSRGSLT